MLADLDHACSWRCIPGDVSFDMSTLQFIRPAGVASVVMSHNGYRTMEPRSLFLTKAVGRRDRLPGRFSIF